jgi:hypothetical protein
MKYIYIYISLASKTRHLEILLDRLREGNRVHALGRIEGAVDILYKKNQHVESNFETKYVQCGPRQKDLALCAIAPGIPRKIFLARHCTEAF